LRRFRRQQESNITRLVCFFPGKRLPKTESSHAIRDKMALDADIAKFFLRPEKNWWFMERKNTIRPRSALKTGMLIKYFQKSPFLI